VDALDCVLPLIADEGHLHEADHLDCLHKNLLVLAFVEQPFKGLAPTNGNLAFLLIVAHDVVGVEFDHFLHSKDDQVGPLTGLR
jgi:hypothetical protein